MKTLVRRGRLALLLTLLALMASGCMGGASLSNPGWTVLTADADVVYTVLATGQVTALNAVGAGQELWLYPVKAAASPGFSLFSKQSAQTGDQPLNAVYGLPVLTPDLVLATTFDHQVYALDRKTGARVWTYTPENGEGSLVGGLTLKDDIAYFGSANGKVYALDITTQEPLWAQPFQTGNKVWGAPAVDESRVYIGSMDRKLYALDRQTGAQVWAIEVGASVPGDVTFADGVLYVGAIDQRMHAYKANDGSLLWQTEQLGGWVWGDALVHKGVVYFGTLRGDLHAYDAQTGQATRPAIVLEGAVRAGPVAFGDELVVGTDSGKVYLVNTSTGVATPFPAVEGGVLSRPSVVGNDVFVATTVGKVYAFNVERGIAQLWVYPPSKK